MPNELTKYAPSLIEKVASGASLKVLLLEFLLGAVAPEIALPALFVTFLSDITSSANIANYTAIVANVTGAVHYVLSSIKTAKDLGFIGDVSSDDLKKIAQALYVKEDNVDITLAELMQRISTFKPTVGSNAGTNINLAQIMYGQYANGFVVLPDNKIVPLAELLAAMANNGFFRHYEEIPLNGENGG